MKTSYFCGFIYFSGTDWTRLNELVNLAKWDLIFDFNEFLRQGDSWYPDNARELLKFSQEQGYRIPCFQLGNGKVDELHRALLFLIQKCCKVWYCVTLINQTTFFQSGYL